MIVNINFSGLAPPNSFPREAAYFIAACALLHSSARSTKVVFLKARIFVLRLQVRNNGQHEGTVVMYNVSTRDENTLCDSWKYEQGSVWGWLVYEISR
jgi:hypothetical protein